MNLYQAVFRSLLSSFHFVQLFVWRNAYRIQCAVTQVIKGYWVRTTLGHHYVVTDNCVSSNCWSTSLSVRAVSNIFLSKYSHFTIVIFIALVSVMSFLCDLIQKAHIILSNNYTVFEFASICLSQFSRVSTYCAWFRFTARRNTNGSDQNVLSCMNVIGLGIFVRHKIISGKPNAGRSLMRR